MIADFVRSQILWSALVIFPVHDFPCYNVFFCHFHEHTFIIMYFSMYFIISLICVRSSRQVHLEYWELGKGQ